MITGFAGVFQSHIDERAILRMQGMLSLIPWCKAHRAEWRLEALGAVGTVGDSANEIHLMQNKPTAIAPDIIVVGFVKITNKKELRGVLREEFRDPSITSDIDFLTAAYCKWGQDLFNYIQGDFAFCLCDPDKERMILAKDCMGTRPLYYSISNGHFSFCSYLKALALTETPIPVLNPEMLRPFMVGIPENATNTIYRNIFRFPPAHYCIVGTNEISFHRYWFPEKIGVNNHDSAETFVERFRSDFLDAVNQRIDSASTGYFLSGGLDSTSIVAAANVLYPDREKPVFSAVYRSERSSEERYIDAAGQSLNVSMHKYFMEDANSLEIADPYISIASEPNIYENMAVKLNAFALASGLGLKSLFDGYDGDSVFTHGQDHYAYLYHRKQYFRLYGEFKRAYKAGTLASKPDLFTVVLKNGHFKSLRKWFPHKAREQENIKHWLAQIPQNSKAGNGFFFPADSDSHPEQAFHIRLLGQIAKSTVMDVLSDCAFQKGLSVTFPFWDRRLLELGLSLPRSLKIRNGVSRIIIREGMRNVLPELIRERNHKADLSHGFRLMMGRFIPDIERAWREEGSEGLREYIRHSLVEETIEKIKSGSVSVADLKYFWRILVIKRWMSRNRFGFA